MVPLLVLAACVWPSTVGLRTDALLPPPGKAEVVLGAGTDALPLPDEEQSTTLVGGSATVGVSDDLAVSMGVASNDWTWMATELELRLKLPEAYSPGPWSMVVLGGISPILDFEGESLILGGLPAGQGGWVAGRPLWGPLRLYGGFRVNLVPAIDLDGDGYLSDLAWLWWHPTLGLSLRQPVAGRASLLAGLEVTEIVGLYPADLGHTSACLVYLGVGPAMAP